MGLSQEFYDRVIANVNLKVIMRLGDNRTAEDMSEWIGKVTTTKRTVTSGISTSKNAREFTKHLEFNKKAAEGYREGFTEAEDETELVSVEELKHEMSAEKGLAWFDKGDGRLRKGRAIWFDADLPSTWEGREFLTRYESVEADEIGLAEWVDEHILSVERAETKRSHNQVEVSTDSAPEHAKKDNPPLEDLEPGSPFRLNLFKGFKGMGRSRTTFAEQPEEKAATQEAPAANKQEEKKPDEKPAAQATESGNNNKKNAAPMKMGIGPKNNANKQNKNGKLSLGGKSKDVIADVSNK